MAPTLAAGASSSRQRDEDLIYSFEAEEEPLTNQLSTRLELFRDEKIQLEDAVEGGSGPYTSGMRELAGLRAERQRRHHDHLAGGVGTSRQAINGNTTYSNALPDPHQEVMLDAMRRENESLRARLAESERDCMQLSRMNDAYRQELIDLRRRLGLPIDNLIGLAASPSDVYSQPPRLGVTSSISVHPAASAHVAPDPQSSRPVLGLPIPISRAPSASHAQSHRQPNYSSSTASLANSPSSYSVPASPFPFSPSTSSHHGHGHGDSATSSSTGSAPIGGHSLSLNNDPSSYLTQITTPPSSTSPLLHMQDPTTPYVATLTYPSVPPPSLSSSLGSPVYSRRSSFGQGPGGRRMSLERGAVRIAEIGTLRASVPVGLPSDVVEESPPDSPDHDGSSPASVVDLNDRRA